MRRPFLSSSFSDEATKVVPYGPQIPDPVWCGTGPSRGALARDGMQELMLMPIRTEMFDWGGLAARLCFEGVLRVLVHMHVTHKVDGSLHADVKA